MSVKQHRGMAKAKITRIKNFTEKFPLDSEQPVQQYETRLTMLDDAFISFTDFHNKVVAEVDSGTELDHEDYYVPVEQDYLETKSNLQIIIEKRRSREMVQPVFTDPFNQNKIIPKNEIKLPKLSLPTFCGDYSEWTTFFDLFKCTVDANNTLTNAQKLQYLKSVLKGEALQLIQHFSITDYNYFDAWNTLQQRYNKKKHIINNYITKFTGLPSVTQQNARQLRHLISTADVILRGISALGYESRDPWIIFMLLQKLDPETQSMWSLEISGKDEPTQEELFKFLEKRCDALESCHPRSIVVNTNNQSIPEPNSNSIHSLYQFSSYKCSICFFEEHHLYECRQFRGWDVSAREEFVKENNHCYNCLKPSHSVAICNNKYSCKECGERHHTLLHVDSRIQQSTDSQESQDEDCSQSSQSSQQSTTSQDDYLQESSDLQSTATQPMEPEISSVTSTTTESNVQPLQTLHFSVNPIRESYEININELIQQLQHQIKEHRQNYQLIVEQLGLMSTYSCLNRLIRITVWCLRFVQSSTHSQEQFKEFLSASDLFTSQKIYIKEVQQDAFNDEIKLLGYYKLFSPNIKLITLYPSLNSNGLLRKSGRLKYSANHLQVLPSNLRRSQFCSSDQNIFILHAINLYCH